MLFLQHECPEVLARARWLLEPVDYLTMRFTGVPAATLASMTGAWLTDIRSLTTLDYDEVLVRAAGVDGSRLPPLVATGSVLGPVLPDVATDLRIPATAVAVTGLPDLHAAAVGAGAVELGQPHASIGTTAWISAPVPRKKTDVLRRQASVPGLDNASYLLPTTRTPPGATSSGGATPSLPTPPSTHCSPRPHRRRREPGASCSPRGSPASARRSTTATPARAFTGSARPRPAET